MKALLDILSIAKLEIKKNRSKVEKRVLLVMFLLAALIYLSVTLFVNLGITTTEKYYTFFSEDQKLQEILLSTGKFILSDDANTDLILDYDSESLYVYARNQDRAKAALSVVEKAIKEYNFMIYKNYDPALAYPLRIMVEPLEREEKTLESMIKVTREKDLEYRKKYTQEKKNKTSFENQDEIDVDTNSDKLDNMDNSDIVLDKNQDSDYYNNNSYSDNNVGGKVQKFGNIEIRSNLGSLSSNFSENKSFNESSSNSVENSDLIEYGYTVDMNPFSQFKTLFIVILMTLPLSMLTLIFSNSIMSEKINKRGIFLLMSPIKSIHIIIGKSLPYIILSFVGLMPVVIKNTDGFLDGLYSVLILLSVVIAYLSIGFIVAMLSRSHKDLSFLGVFFISLYSCYLLIPTFMLNFSEISMASPLSIVAMLFQSETVTFKLLLFSFLPTFITACSIFYFGSKLFNDRNMFSYRSIKDKIFDATSIILKNRFNLFWISFFSIPLAFLIEIMIFVFMLSLKSWTAVYGSMFFWAFVEEMFRNLGIYTIISKKLEKLNAKKIFVYAFISALGFFIAEKGLLLIMIAPFAKAHMTLAMGGLLLIPFLIHFILSVLFGFTARVMKRPNFIFLVSFTTIVHFFINFSINFMLMRFG